MYAKQYCQPNKGGSGPTLSQYIIIYTYNKSSIIVWHLYHGLITLFLDIYTQFNNIYIVYRFYKIKVLFGIYRALLTNYE